ncbi:MAG: hypothetical protein NTX81_06040 [Candidatus Bathyarchaeota archaeon]|nr:hypothetical protein [Candidatus Bathyarchaeota archaeon]
MNTQLIGRWAFIVFVIVAVLAGLAAGFGGRAALGWVSLVMVILGIIVGLTTLTEKEATPFLTAAIALLVANSGQVFLVIDEVAKPLGTVINATLTNIAAFVAPAAILLAVKAIYNLAKT